MAAVSTGTGSPGLIKPILSVGVLERVRGVILMERVTKQLVCSVFVFGVMGGGAFAQVIHVDPGATGAQDGSTWCTAFRNLQAGLDAATPGTTIVVANGTYLPETGGLTDPREATFALASGVTLQGGYAGCGAADSAARDFVATASILSGDLIGNDDPAFVNRGDNCYHVVTAYLVDDTAVLDGFTVRGGQADGPNFGATPESKDQGSGINVYDSTPHVKNCTVMDCYSLNHGAFNDHGGATLTDCTISDNYSGNVAAGLYMHFNMDTTVVGCTFRDNTTEGKGGGAYNKGNTTSTFLNCLFEGNTALSGGGMYCDNDSNPTLTNCTFTANTAIGDATSSGGGMYNNGGSSPTLDGCTFSGNSAATKGGGMYNDNNAAPTLSNSSFTSNTATLGAGMYNFISTAPTLSDCTFDGNSASGRGGAMYNQGTNPPGLTRPKMTRCNFVGNLATTPFGEGGAIYSSVNAAPDIKDCRFIDNRSTVAGGAMATYAPGSGPPYFMTNCTFIGNVCTLGRGGAMHIAITGVFQLDNCVLSGNSAPLGGAMSIHNTNAILTNCSLSNNEASSTGGALWIASSANVTVTNSILWGNRVLDTGATDESAQIQRDDGTVDVTFSCIEGLGPIFAGEGNIGVDPGFANADGVDGVIGTEDDNLRLAANSPCINTGTNAVLVTQLDLDGGVRINNDTVDMGAYESPFVAPIPTVSQWGVVAMVLLLLTAATVLLRGETIAESLRRSPRSANR